MSQEEFEGHLGLNQKIPHEENAGLPQHEPGKPFGNLSLPDKINWATSDNPKNAPKMYPVVNQGACGSCWAFAVSAVMSGTAAIKYD